MPGTGLEGLTEVSNLFADDTAEPEKADLIDAYEKALRRNPPVESARGESESAYKARRRYAIADVNRVYEAAEWMGCEINLKKVKKTK